MKSVRLMTILFVLVLISLVDHQVSNALEVTTLKAHPDRSFSTGWTHAIDTPNGIFWYNSQTGSGVLGKLDSAGNHTSFKTSSYSKGWTHIINTPNGILWYNTQTGAGALGQFDSAGNYTNAKTLYFSPGWTNIVSTPEGIIWYNARNGSAVVGRFE
jgi:streptogramin lyase